jgi:hypothetical protein
MNDSLRPDFGLSARVEALAPKPRVSLIRFHGVLLWASYPTPFEPALGCSKLLPAILSSPTVNIAPS